MYTIDTNIIIYYRNGEPSVVSFLHEQLDNGVPLYVSSITEHELFSYPKLTDTETKQIDELLTTMTVIDVDSRMARFSGYLRAHHGIKALDSFIAATAMMRVVRHSCKKLHPPPSAHVVNNGLISNGTGGVFISMRYWP